MVLTSIHKQYSSHGSGSLHSYCTHQWAISCGDNPNHILYPSKKTAVSVFSGTRTYFKALSTDESIEQYCLLQSHKATGHTKAHTKKTLDSAQTARQHSRPDIPFSSVVIAGDQVGHQWTCHWETFTSVRVWGCEDISKQGIWTG